MKKASFTTLFVSLALLCAAAAQARDSVHFFPIQNALKMSDAKRLRGEINYYFADQPHPSVGAMLSQGVVTSKKGTMVVNSAVIEANDEIRNACSRTFLVALAQLQARARRVGGNAVVNIESYYRKDAYRSNDQFECHTGYAKVGVMLKGDIVRLNN